MLSAYDRRVLWMRARQMAGLSPSRLEKTATGPRIAVIANCQTFGIAFAMDFLVKGARVDPIQVLLGNRTRPELLAKVLRDYDLVFALKNLSNLFPAGSGPSLEELRPDVRCFPQFAFPGYHPDFIALQAYGAPRPVAGLMNISQSAIVATAWKLGLSQQAAMNLLREDVFQRLGYFDAWEPSWNELIRLGSECGLDLAPLMVSWTRRGCFMYTPLHPKSHVHFDIAKLLLKNAGVSIRDGDFDRHAVDRLVDDSVLPVYPEIARRLGLKGDYVFKRATHPGIKRKPYFYSLDEFVSASYRSYETADPANMTHPRIEDWLKNPQVLELFGAKQKPA